MTFENLYKSFKYSLPLALVVMVIAGHGAMDPYLAYVATSWVIFGLLAMSLDLVWGRGGVLSLGQTAFYGLGGYFGAVVAVNMAPVTGNSLIWLLPAGALFGAIAAALVGYLIFYARTGPLQTTILTYTFTLVLWTLTQSFKLTVGDAVIGGDNGMSNIPGYILGFGEGAESADPNLMFLIVVVISALAYLGVVRFMDGSFGRIIDCIRLDEEKAELLGYDVRKFQLYNFLLAGGVAGLAGGLYAGWANYLNPSIFSVQEALLVPIYVLVGGRGTLSGAFVGALLIGGVSFWLGGGAIGGQTTLILGITLIILVMFLKKGLLGALDDLCQRFLPDYNAAARDMKPVEVDSAVVSKIMLDAEAVAGPAKSLQSRDLLKRFGGVVPVDHVSLSFGPGTPHSLIGPNGAGKSSYLKVCVGLYPQDGGQILLGDQDISSLPMYERVRAGIAVKNQKPQVFPELSVQENLWMAAYSMSREPEKAGEVSSAILHMLGMDKQREVSAAVLSHGQQQWLDIGMVLCLAPRVILFDEPAAGMTNEETRELSKLVRLLSQYVTIIVIEHDMEFVRTLDGAVTVLHQGRLFTQGSIAKLRNDERVLDIYLGRRAHVQNL
ncbi:ABC transporter permease subunit [Sneathiella chinensis]|uniref:ABC transporter ATP-binding protein n=1 Tax=Sneathiella chinensis TaxID=349750 RepID=A0ABQ5U3N9_9PROT|nr:ATP-binding cassette domain-containing protein [Sneathiella chinensis]GLQ06769.1 ABC transporter ATP-binding protein [Sneathiella chinensis]